MTSSNHELTVNSNLGFFNEDYEIDGIHTPVIGDGTDRALHQEHLPMPSHAPLPPSAASNTPCTRVYSGKIGRMLAQPSFSLLMHCTNGINFILMTVFSGSSISSLVKNSTFTFLCFSHRSELITGQMVFPHSSSAQVESTMLLKNCYLLFLPVPFQMIPFAHFMQSPNSFFLLRISFFTMKPYMPLLKHCVSSIVINPAYSLQVVVEERMGHLITFKYQSSSWPSILCTAHRLWVLLISGAVTSPSIVISLVSRPHSAYSIDMTTMASVVDSLIDKKNNVFSSSSPASRLQVCRYSTR